MVVDRVTPRRISGKTVRFCWGVLILWLVAILALEFFIPFSSGYSGLASTFGFHAVYGFTACLGIILFSLLLGFILKRKESYYVKEPTDAS